MDHSIQEDLVQFLTQKTELVESKEKLGEAFVLPAADKETLQLVISYMKQSKSINQEMAALQASLKSWVGNSRQNFNQLNSVFRTRGRDITQPDIKDLLSEAQDVAREDLEKSESLLQELLSWGRDRTGQINSMTERINEYIRDIKMGHMG